jgi:protein-tyrosine phosphatase
VIDLHCHILPGIDDGPDTLEAAVELARQLASDGVSVVAATPHYRDDHPGVRPSELSDRCQELSDTLQSDGLTLQIVPAAEVDLIRALDATDEELVQVSYGQRGSDLLVESPYGPLPTSFDERLFGLAVQGYRILLAHPERNPTFQQRPRLLGELVRRGVLLQITSDSLRRRRKRQASGELARALVADRLAHVLATDAHGARTPDRGLLYAGVAEARQLAGSYADWMVEDAPAAILAGEALTTAPPAPQQAKRSWWRPRRA